MVGRPMIRAISLLLIGVLLVCAACTKPKPRAATREILPETEAAVPTVQPSPGQTVISVWETSTPSPMPTIEVPVVPLPTSTVTATVAPTAAPAPLPTVMPTSMPESAPVASEAPGIHTVQRGETLFAIGLQYGIPWQDIARANGIDNPGQIFAGQKLTIPQEGEQVPVPPQAPAPPTEERIHIVQQGENLFRIGLKYGMDWQEIAQANGIVNSTDIYVGQKLVIP
jgi:LysM repeat protein